MSGNQQVVLNELSFGVAHNGTHLFNSAMYTIQIYDPQLNLVDSFGIRGSGEGQNEMFMDIEVNDTHIFAADNGNKRIHIYDLSGNFISHIGSAGEGDGQFEHPIGLAVNSKNIIVSDQGNHSIQIFDLNGKFVSKIGSTFGVGNYQFHDPMGIEANEEFFFVADSRNQRVVIYDLNGNYISEFGNSEFDSTQFDHVMSVAWNGSHLFTGDTYSWYSTNGIAIWDLDFQFFTSTETRISTDYQISTTTNFQTSTETTTYTKIDEITTKDSVTDTSIVEVTKTKTIDTTIQKSEAGPSLLFLTSTVTLLFVISSKRRLSNIKK